MQRALKMEFLLLTLLCLLIVFSIVGNQKIGQQNSEKKLFLFTDADNHCIDYSSHWIQRYPIYFCRSFKFGMDNS